MAKNNERKVSVFPGFLRPSEVGKVIREGLRDSKGRRPPISKKLRARGQQIGQAAFGVSTPTMEAFGFKSPIPKKMKKKGKFKTVKVRVRV